MENQTLLWVMAGFVIIAALSMLFQMMAMVGLYRQVKTMQEMAKAMRFHIHDANGTYIDRPRTEWIYQHPCQAIIVASRGWFTSETHSAFQQMEEGTETAMKDFLNCIT